MPARDYYGVFTHPLERLLAVGLSLLSTFTFLLFRRLLGRLLLGLRFPHAADHGGVFAGVWGGGRWQVAGTAHSAATAVLAGSQQSKSHTVAAPARVSQNTQSSLIEISRNLAHRSPEIWRTAVFAEGARNFCNGGGMSENLPQERTSTHNLLQARATRCKTNEQPDEKLLQHPQFIRNVTRTGLGQRPEGAGKKRGGWA